MQIMLQQSKHAIAIGIGVANCPRKYKSQAWTPTLCFESAEETANVSRVQHRARISGSQVRRGTPLTWYRTHTRGRGILIYQQFRNCFYFGMLRHKTHPHVLFVI